MEYMDRSIDLDRSILRGGKMAASCRALVVTGAAVALYGLAVSFGPALLLGRAPTAVDHHAPAQVQFSEPLHGASVILRQVEGSSSCAACARVMLE